jgi:ferredoxin
MLVINPEECIDCAACEPSCPVDAIVSNDTAVGSKWAALNREYSTLWPRIVEKAPPPVDAKDWERVADKFASHFDSAAGTDHEKNVRISRSPHSGAGGVGDPDGHFS